MREIKFRGKRIDNGEWVHGYIVKVASPCGLGWVMHIPAKDPDDNHRVVKVNPSTVGQYTGLKDKNGTEIYEGDILHRGGYWDLYVDFIDGAFCLVSCIEIQRINWSPTPIWNADIPGREVVGNIHDNPELLGGAE